VDRVNEGLETRFLPPGERDAEVARLTDPWIGDEGALDAGFRQGLGDQPLRLRGVAFDPRTTVVWDESGVQVVQPAAADAAVVALRSPVLLHPRFQETGPRGLLRIDYLRHGALVASRFAFQGGDDA
jgi:hypothetical protein